MSAPTNSTTLRQVCVVPATLADPVPFDKWIAIATDFGIQPKLVTDGNGIYLFSNRDGAFCLYLQPLEPAPRSGRLASRASRGTLMIHVCGLSPQPTLPATSRGRIRVCQPDRNDGQHLAIDESLVGGASHVVGRDRRDIAGAIIGGNAATANLRMRTGFH